MLHRTLIFVTALAALICPAESFSLRMDTGEAAAFVRRIPRPPIQLPSSLTLPPTPTSVLDEAQASIGMPWTASLDDSQALTFMPFWNHQIDTMKEHLVDLKALPVSNTANTRDFGVAHSDRHNRNVRVANMAFSSKHFRKIRMTYYDAGPQAQVYNSLWYPDPKYNLPVLGIDLLQFHGGKKQLAVVDFQPIHDSEDEHAQRYEHLMAPIRAAYPKLQGKMSARFYNENEFFSQQMLFSRFEDPTTIQTDLWPAFQDYLSTYLKLASSTSPNEATTDLVSSRQEAYDVYSAARDPAIHMFTNQFGKDWAEEYVHEFLFDKSRPTEQL